MNQAKKSQAGLPANSNYNYIAQDTSGTVKVSVSEPKPMLPTPGIVKWEGDTIKKGAALSTNASLNSLKKLI